MSVLIKWPERIAPGQAEVEAIVTGADDFEDALSQLASDLPAAWGDMGLSTIGTLETVPGVDGMWIAKPVYKIVPDKPNGGQLKSGEFEFAFSSSRQSIKRTISIESVCYDADGLMSTPPQDAQLINCDPKTGAPRGVDVVEYLNAFRWRVAVPFSTAAESWRRSVGRLRGSLNQEAFFGYDAQSVVFEDITGSVKGNELYVFDLSFTQKDHQEDVDIGGIEIAEIDAWSVIDVETEPQVQTIGGTDQLLPKVTRVKIHRVNPVASWSSIISLLGMT